MRKQAKKSIFIYLFLGVSCLFISRNHTESYWSIHEGKTQRAPSSQELLSNSDPLLLRDFFSNNNKMRIELWTDRNDESIKKQGRLALEQALSKTLLSRKMSNLSKEIFEKNMIESFSKNFLSSLALLKVVGGTFQIDLHFEPSEVNNFIEIMNTNQLIDQSSRGSLLNAIEQRPISFGKKILARIPQKQESRYHSLGGSITLWFKIQEQNLNIKENLTEGFVKYRRYFSMKREWTPELHLDGDGASLKGKWENSSYPRVLTVDITSPLNLESLIPKPGKLEVFYGKIKFPQKYETGLLRNIDIFSKDINVNKFLLNGDGFSMHIKELEFNLEDQRFSQSSKIQSFGNWDGFSLGQKRAFKTKTRRTLLGPKATDLIKEFSLYRFEHSFKKVGGK